LVAGSTKELGLNSDTVQNIATQFAKSRDQHKRKPKWRKSFGSRRSLGWIPFQAARAIKVGNGFVKYLGVKYPIWMHRPIEGVIKCGSFNEDASGRWYINLQCDVPEEICVGSESIGIDLGLKDMATLSTGEKLANPRYYRQSEEKLAKAQRAGRKKRVQAIHRKIKNKRKYDLHVASKQLVQRCKEIYVGNVNSSQLAKTRMAKSIYDVSWSQFREMLRYKAIRHGVTFAIVNEAYSSQTCSMCGILSGPKGLEGLGVREWVCDCGVIHNRDVNAAINILLSGQSAGLQ
jgi:IS605 OrfB family transposase